MKLKSKLKFIFEPEEIKSGDKVYAKRSLLIETGSEKYPKELQITVFNNQELLNLINSMKVGVNYTFTLELSSREYNGKYYHNINCIDIKGTFFSGAIQNNELFEEDNSFEPSLKTEPFSNFQPIENSTLFNDAFADTEDDLPF